jgi:uncharacterized protein YndB with AHSA1/START domain
VSELTVTDLRLERTIDASAEEVFDAWTNPEVLRRWWAADLTWVTPVAEVDLRVGGRYRLSMEDPATGTTHTVGGEYHEVKRPERLVYSWCWERSDGQLDHTSTVTVEFLGTGDSTTIVLEHTKLASAESRDGHRAGWIACFETLQARGIFAGALESQ